MLGWTESEIFLYAGIAGMAGAVILTVVCLIVFSITGKKIKKTLEKEYGKPPVPEKKR